MGAPGGSSAAQAAAADTQASGCAALPGQTALRLDQLPPDLLQRILAASLELYDDTKAAVHLSLVSRGFRRALQGPSCMWRSFRLLRQPPMLCTPEALLSLGLWLRPRCAQLAWLEAETSPSCLFAAVVGLLAPRLEHADLRGLVDQATVDQLTTFGSDRLAVLHLRKLARGVQLGHITALNGLHGLSLEFGCDERNRPYARELFPSAICDCSQLVELNLTYRDLGVLPHALSRLTALRRLNVSLAQYDRSRRFVVEAGLGQLRSLEALRMHHCALRAEWPSLSALTALAELEFFDCTFDGACLLTSCAAAPALTRLTCNYVCGCGLDRLQPGDLSALASLTLEDCSVREFPEAACELRGLTSLVLTHNRHLQSLPRAISRLTSLQVLDLSGKNPFMRRLVEDEEGELGLVSALLPVELARLSRLELLILTNLSFRLEAGLCCALADMPSLECVALGGALPSRSSVRELVMLGVHLQTRGRLNVLQW